MKVTVVGAGAVGASSAEYIAIKNFASEVVLVDIKENLAEGKAMDLMQTASLNGFDTKIIGSTNKLGAPKVLALKRKWIHPVTTNTFWNLDTFSRAPIISIWGSGPDRGQSPVEWGDFPYIHPSVRP